MDMVALFLCLGVFLLGAIVGCAVTLSLLYPLIGRAIGRVSARIIATLTLAFSAALLTWPTWPNNTTTIAWGRRSDDLDALVAQTFS